MITILNVVGPRLSRLPAFSLGYGIFCHDVLIFMQVAHEVKFCRRSGVTLPDLQHARNRITALLGQNLPIQKATAGDFRKRMAEYVDSNNKLNDVQSWAVVKSCRISHNWPVSTAPPLHCLCCDTFTASSWMKPMSAWEPDQCTQDCTIKLILSIARRAFASTKLETMRFACAPAYASACFSVAAQFFH